MLAIPLLTALLLAPPVHAGAKVKLVEGALSAITLPCSMSVEWSYTNTMVGKTPEATYLTEKVNEKNAANPGDGDAWLASWNRDKDERFHPAFLELLNKSLESRMTCGTNLQNSTWIMKVEVKRIEPGFFSYAVNKPAELDLEVRIVSAAAPDTVVARITVDRAPGASATTMANSDTGSRISESYAKAGKDLGRLLAKNLE